MIPCRPIEVFLRPTYLVQSLTGSVRLQCFMHHYLVVTETIRPASLAQLFDVGIIIFAQTVNDIRYEILLFQPKANRNEGELSLALIQAGVEIFTYGVTFVPGAVVGARGETTLLISRMQGSKGFEEIRMATKAFLDIAPQALLFAALRGVVRAFGVASIVGPCARRQQSYGPNRAGEFAKTYDEFFVTVGAARNAKDFYVVDGDVAQDILANLPAKHRSRTKTKRIFKAAVTDKAFAALAPHLKTGPVSDEAGQLFVCASHLATRVGERQGATIAATGATGVLACGPYPPVLFEPGRYEASFLTQPEGGPENFRAEVSADFGATLLARGESHDLDGLTPLRLSFEVAPQQDAVEFRVIVPETSFLVLRGINIARRSPPNAGLELLNNCRQEPRLLST